MTQDAVDKFRKGKELCLKNFEMWIDEARILDQKGSWGHAFALTFAGLESLVQAYCCMYVERGIWEPDSKEIKEVFNKTNKGHKKRMKILHDFILSENNIQTILKHTDQFHVLLRNFTEKDVAKYQKEIADSLGKFRKYLMKKRNLGMYVDYNEDTYEFKSPFHITKKDIDELMELTILPVRIMRMMIENEAYTKIWDFREKY